MTDAAALLTATTLNVHLGQRLAVSGVTLTLKRGEFCVLVGPNGAGKTTLMRALAGLLPASGDIAIEGVLLASLTPPARARRIAYLPQGHIFHWPMDVEAIVGLGRQPFADPFGRLSPTDRTAIQRAMAQTGVTAFAGRSILELSGGERARVAIARALASETPLLFADEPTASLDPLNQLVVMELLRKVARDGASVLAIVHDLQLAARFADRIVVLSEGCIAIDGSPDAALANGVAADVFGVTLHRVLTPDGPVIVTSRSPV